MHVRTHLIRGSDFVRTKPGGELDLEQSKRFLRQAAQVADSKVFCEILIDLRDAKASRLTPAEIFELAASLRDSPSLYWRKLAILLPPEAPGIKADQFQVLANNLGFRVQTFKEFEQAIYWLSYIQEVSSKDLA